MTEPKSAVSPGRTQSQLILATAVFVTLTANVTFFQKVTDVYPLSVANLGFLISIPLVLAASLVFGMSVLSSRYTIRPVLIAFVISASVVGYFTDTFGTVFDKVMIANVFATDTGEATDLISWGLLWRVLLLGVIPAWVIARVNLDFGSPAQEVSRKCLLGAGALATALVCILGYSSSYADFFREHKPLRYYTTPTYAWFSLGKYVEVRLSQKPETGDLRLIGSDAAIPAGDSHRELTILVVGETARADRFSLNGYARETNPRLKSIKNLFTYTDISSCGTSTSVSVPCMFALEGRRKFDLDRFQSSENILDVLQRVGVRVLWRDNNSNSRKIAKRVEYQDFRDPSVNPVCDEECRDVGMLSGLEDYIKSHEGDLLIVLHQMGNHGPAYFKRYPSEFERFKPACHSVELSRCSSEEIGNAYDNAVLYTDFFLSKVVELLVKFTPEFETFMLYVSDHGESLGEKGLYLHGLPYLLAPKEQTHVPLIVWLGESSDVTIASIEHRSETANSHDAIFDALLDIFEVDARIQKTVDPLFDVATEK